MLKKGKMKRENLLVLIFGSLFLLSMIMLASQGFKTTGYATETSTTSNVTISVYFSIDMSNNLSDGIQFGDVNTLPATNVNGSRNYDFGYNTTEDTNASEPGTTYWLNVSTDSNSAVDFCLKADALNTSGGDEIGLDNETYANYSETNSTWPSVGDEVGFTTSYVKSGNGVAVGDTHYYRFWLDVPAATATGTYNNTVSFKGITTGGSC